MDTIVTTNQTSPHAAAFIDNLQDIKKAIRAVCRDRHVSRDDEPDFIGSVMLKLIANDYAVLRQHNGQGTLRTYVYTVAARLLSDERAKRWGRWRPTKRAREIGEHAVHLEMLVHRDGLPVNEAVAVMANAPHWGLTSRSLRSVWVRLPPRLPLDRRPESLAVAENLHAAPPIDVVEDGERRNQARRARQALRLALQRLSSDDRRLLRQNYNEDRKILEIAAATGRKSGALYTQRAKIIGRLRGDLRQQGLTDDVIREVLLHAMDELDALLGEVCVSGTRTLPLA
jgi:RNA polymerase sigma factor (sigma-70 family)